MHDGVEDLPLVTWIVAQFDEDPPEDVNVIGPVKFVSTTFDRSRPK